MDEARLTEIAEAWRKETDECVVAEATQDTSEFPPEIHAIIRDEALHRGLISSRANKDVANTARSESLITEKGQQALDDWRETRPKAVVTKLTRMLVALLATGILIGIVSAVLGLRESAITGAAAYGLYIIMEEILRPRRESAHPEARPIVARRGNRRDNR